MKLDHHIPSSRLAPISAKAEKASRRSLILSSLSLLIFLLASGFVLQGQNAAQDPGPRTGTAQSGAPIAGLTADQTAYFNDGLSRFQEVESVQNGENNGLGPTFNSNSCSSCHAQPQSAAAVLP